MAKSAPKPDDSGLPPGVTATERAVASQVYQKLMRGETLTATEQTTLRKYERAKEEQTRWKYYASIPQKHWRQMSGRQSKVLHDQQRTYGLPVGGPTVNLPEFVRAFHDFLAKNSRVLNSGKSTGEGANSPALERYREERAKIVRLDRLAREGELLPRAYVQEGLASIASLLRGLGETLQRMYGPEALRLLDEVLDECDREVQRLFSTATNADEAANDDTHADIEESDGDATKPAA